MECKQFANLRGLDLIFGPGPDLTPKRPVIAKTVMKELRKSWQVAFIAMFSTYCMEATFNRLYLTGVLLEYMWLQRSMCLCL